MKTIGLIGGMSWESTSAYYRIINETVKERLGKLHSAKCVVYSVDFELIADLQHRGEWEQLTKLMISFARKVEKAGADCIVICTNTMHKMAREVQSSITIPLLHIADAAAERITEQGLGKPGLLGTKFTMEEDFYIQRLKEKYHLDVIVPSETDRSIVDGIIYRELCLGIFMQSTKETLKGIIGKLVADGADALILGCTELPLLINQEDVDIPIFDTTAIHSTAAVAFALE